MKGPYKAIKVSDNVYWVGAIDRYMTDFHGYLTPKGTTYNAYLVIADKITLIDTVKAPFMDEMISRIESVIPIEKIEYIISNHAEMDHSGGLKLAKELIKPEKIFASTLGATALKEHHLIDDAIPVKDGEILSLGNMNLTFIETRMIHWPDSMFSYLDRDQILFSQDAFGMHWATFERFADELDKDILKYEAATYYANIVMPFSDFVLKILDKVSNLNIPIKIIAPDHGPIWRKDLGTILNLYKHWAEKKPNLKAVVVYDTMWHSTEAMARAVSEGLYKGGADVHLMPLNASHRTFITKEVLDAGALLIGSPTFNRTILPTVADYIYYIKGLRPKNLVGATFGSYGWSGEATKIISDQMVEFGVQMIAEPIKIKFVPDTAALQHCFNLGEMIAGKLLDHCEMCKG